MNDVAATPHPEEDQPTRLEPGLPPEVASPLAPFEGREPESPAWFKRAIAKAPERRLVPVQGANIELLTWGEVGKPGLILVHGNSAHADWWSFIAPFFARPTAWPRSRSRAWAAPTGGELQLPAVRRGDPRLRPGRRPLRGARRSRSTSATPSAARRCSIARPTTPSGCARPCWSTPASADRRPRRSAPGWTRRIAPPAVLPATGAARRGWGRPTASIRPWRRR